MGCTLSSSSSSTLQQSKLADADTNATDTTDATAVPTLHYHPASQPSRSVEMLFTIGNIPFKPVVVNIMAGEKCKPNPMGSVPFLEDPAYGVSMGEGLAILVHLAETRLSLLPLYPKKPATRAVINYWLHWHHSGSRKSTMFLRSLFMSDDVSAHETELYKALANLMYMEQALGRQGTLFFAGDELSIADLALITEVDQIDATTDFVFGDGLFPRLDAWRERCGEVPAYKNNPGHSILNDLMGHFAPKLAALKEAVGPKLAEVVRGLAAASPSAGSVELAAADDNNDGKVTPDEIAAYLMKLDMEEQAAAALDA